MKKRIGIIIILLGVVLVIISTILLIRKDDSKTINSNESTIAYYYQNGSGYTEGASNTWTTGYVLNVGKSICNNQENPKDILNWDSENKSVLMSSNENINCTLYFDKAYTAQEFYQKYENDDVGDGELLKHTTSLPNSAGDDGYRYSGDDPNNFICFGPGSEDYNKGVTGATCPDGNLYRMIGYVPVELSNGTKENRIKVIKSEYATADDLGKDKADGIEYFWYYYESLKRVKAHGNLDGFEWNHYDDAYDNTWDSSTLYHALNSNEKSFLNKLGINWESVIEEVQWNVGGIAKDELPKAKIVYDDEWSITGGAQTKTTAKIGLIYPSDYGFASETKSWDYELYSYSDSKGEYHDESNQNRENNWLYNAVEEWTILRRSDIVDYAFSVSTPGNVSYDTSVNGKHGVRPVFYLKSTVTLSGGDGSDSSPYRVN